MDKKENLVVKIVVPIICFFLGFAIMYGIMYKYPTIVTNTITRVERDVSITDTGIAESVEKVYDAVVVVSTYLNNQPYASGTGFVYKSDNTNGYILTNNHVIEQADKVTVQFTNGKVVETTIVGSDKLSDIAVLKVSLKDIIEVASIGSSEKMRVGDTAFTVGAPINNAYSWTVTRGIVSGKNRMVSVGNQDNVMRVLQTDAAINNGNSGGPLCNANGEVIGITSMKLVAQEVEGMGFAINIEDAMNVAGYIERGEKVPRPYIGIQMYNVMDAFYSREYYYYFQKYNITSGVLVYAVTKNGPADKAGLVKDDVIIGVDGKDVSTIGYLRYYLYEHKAGDKVTLKVNRAGDIKNITITLGTE